MQLWNLRFVPSVSGCLFAGLWKVSCTTEGPERTAEKLLSACTSAQEQGTDVQTFQESRVALARLSGHAGPK